MSQPPFFLEPLIKASLAGDERAYATLLKATADLLRPYLLKRLNHATEAEDVLQEILISIHKARHTYDGQRPYKPWVFAIAKFRLTDHLRKHYADHLRQAVDLDEAEFISSEPVTESPFSYESIEEEVKQLTGKAPTILRMMHVQGHTEKEVAHQLNMSESAVKVAAHRAYKILRKKLVGS